MPDFTEAMKGLCATDDDLSRVTSELDDWVRWYRLPGYYLAYLFQAAMLALGSESFVVACVLFADAQTHFAEDLSLSSLENAYTAPTQLGAANDALAPVTADITRRLETTYRYYRKWYSAAPYSDINQLAENLYFEKAWRDLCAAFPELAAPAAAGAPDALSGVIAQCASADDVYCRVVALRHLGLRRAGDCDFRGAGEAYGTALAAANAVHLDAEIGHLHRLLGHALSSQGRFSDADLEFRRAFTHDVHPKFGYWQALSFNEMGDARAKMLPADIDPAHLPPGVSDVADAYANGRSAFESHIGAGVLPIARAVKQQMFRSYADNAIQIAMLRDPAEMLASLEAFGPRYATDVVAESRTAARTLDAAGYARYRAARADYHEHLATLDAAETPDVAFAAYLDDITARRSERQFYVRTRNTIGTAISTAQSSPSVIERALSLRLPETLFLTFNVGSAETHVALIDAASGSVILSAFAAMTLDEWRARHAAYDAAAARSSALPNPAVAMRPALDDLIAFYQATFGRLLDMLAPTLADKHLKIFPRYLMNDMPLHALRAAGRRLIDICDVSYAPSLGLLLQIRESDAATPAPGTLAILRDAARTPAYAGTLAAVAARPNDASVVVEPSWDGFRAALAAHAPTDIFFACHGRFDADEPQRSRLFITANEPVAFTRMFAELDLRGCRSVFMGACESGVGRTLVSAEYIGLPLAFFAAGVRYCIGTLWQVNQVASAIFVAAFYAALQSETRSVPACITEAARSTMAMTRAEVIAWLHAYLPDRAAAWETTLRGMDDPPYAHPYYWAGFYLTGDV